MALQHPVAVFSATLNLEADALRDLLKEAGIEAYAIDTLSPFGEVPPPGMQDAKVWVNEADADRARALITEYEEREAKARAEESSLADGPQVEVRCDDCGQTSRFPITQLGSVQRCPICRAYLDVGESEVSKELANEAEASAGDEAKSE